MAYLRELKVTYQRQRVEDDLLSRPVTAAAQVVALFREMQDETKEKVVVLHLNPQLEVLSYEVAALGAPRHTLIHSGIHPVEIYRNAMLARAHSIIVVHNHATEEARPSSDDRHAAARLDELGRLHDIALQDFIVVGYTAHYSFNEEGALAPRGYVSYSP